MGNWSGELSMNAFWSDSCGFTDEGDKDITTERTPTFATGVSDTIHYMIPTISEINNIEDNEINQLLGEFTEVRVEDREVIATVIGTNGFWVTDYTDAEDGNYASMYVYTFSKPSRIRKGYRLSKLTGGNQEYLGTTQLSFPDYIAVDEGHSVPEPFALTDEQLCDEDVMEKYESASVKVENVQIPSHLPLPVKNIWNIWNMVNGQRLMVVHFMPIHQCSLMSSILQITQDKTSIKFKV